jgi:hypothetical protein
MAHCNILLSYIINRVWIDIVMVFLFSLALIFIMFYGIKLYRATKKSIPLVAEASKKYFIILIVLTMTQMFVRLVFMSIMNVDKLKLS